jgi:hypothetical protein
VTAGSIRVVGVERVDVDSVDVDAGALERREQLVLVRVEILRVGITPIR